MLRAMYTAGVAMLTQTRRMDVITNNISNVETKGFRTDNLTTRSFKDALISRINDPSVYVSDPVGNHNYGIHVDQVYTAFNQGPLDTTNVNTDLALEGDGFFVIRTDQGDRYTRNGAFNVDGAGRLVTPEGDFVMGSEGIITVGSDEFQVNELGEIYVGGNFVDMLRTVTFPSNADLRKQGHNLFYNFNAEANAPVDTAVMVRQGVLENSNVDVARETVNMIECQRNYEANQRILRMVDETLARTVTGIAKA